MSSDLSHEMRSLDDCNKVAEQKTGAQIRMEAVCYKIKYDGSSNGESAKASVDHEWSHMEG